MQTATSQREQVVELIEALSSRHNEPAWLRERRLDAWRLYQELSTDADAPSLAALLKTGRDEERTRRENGLRVGNYCGLIEQQGPEVVSRSLAPEAAAQGIIFTDLHSAAQSAIVREHLMSVVALQEDAFEALNAALWSGGALLCLPAGVRAEAPFHFVAGGAKGPVFRRVLVVAERDSSAAFVDIGASNGRRPAVSDSTIEVTLAGGAHVRYVMLQDWSRGTDCRVTLRAVLNERSRLELMVVDTGGATTKAKLEAVLAAPGADARIVALALADGDQRLEYDTLQEHRAPETVSDLLFKSTLRGRSRLYWRGLTRVHSNAAGTDANQESRSLLLGERAQARPMPVLEIEAHDVSRCSHGATVSSLDEEQLFYLMSRGLSDGDAESAIVEGFFRQALDHLNGDGVRSGVERVLRRKLNRPGRRARKSARNKE